MRRPLQVLAGFLLLSAIFLFLTRPETESLSWKGFDMDAGRRAPSRPLSALPSASSLNSGLSGQMISAPGGVTVPKELAAAGAGEALAQARQTEAPPPAQRQAPAAPLPPPPAPEATPDEAKAAGLPVGASALARAGAVKGLLAPMADKLLEHPKLLRYLANNKVFVDAYFSREKSKRNCGDSKALTSYLSDASAPGGVSEQIGLLNKLLAHPAAAGAVADTEFARRVTSCPSLNALANDRGALTMLAVQSPQLLTMVTNPAALQALSSNPGAHDMLMKMQSSLGGTAR